MATRTKVKRNKSPEHLRRLDGLRLRQEPLLAIIHEGQAGADREGFPLISPGRFVEVFCQHMGGTEDQTVNRIEFEYV